MANPFQFNASVYSTVDRIVRREELNGLSNLSFHRSAEHPAVGRSDARSAPGWNSSNAEVAATDQHGVWIVFDQRGQLIHRGRTSLKYIDGLVDSLLSK